MSQAKPTHWRFQDLEGQKFGRLTVLSYEGRTTHGHSRWKCSCTCGGVRIIPAPVLRRGNSRSCGCLQPEKARQTKITHGKVQTPEYTSWGHMIQRCTNPRNKCYKDYGGRGITVCERWFWFENFFSDMGERPSTGHTLERQDNNLGYCPSNCRWATQAEQSRNQRSNRLLTCAGKTQCLADWAKEVGLHRTTIKSRLNRGVPIEQALFSPLRPGRKFS